MTKIAFLGLGEMGRRMADRLIASDHDVTVWNRSPGPAQTLAARGATQAATPQDAVRDADVVLTMLTDDAASASVWAQATPALSPGALAVEMSTVSPAHVATLSDRVPNLIDAPVAGSLPQAEAGALIFLTGGTASQIDQFHPLASAMGSSIIPAGPVGKGAALKLAVNTALAIQTAMMAELHRLGASHGIAPESLMELLAPTPVLSGTATVMGGLMAAQNYTPLFPIDLLIKDLGYTLDSTPDLPVTRAVRAAFIAASEAGHGAQNISAIAA